MKKLISTISTFVLVLMIPALFIGYLYNDKGAAAVTQLLEKIKQNSLTATRKPVLLQASLSL